MQTKAVIFDLDGTLVDTLADIADACNHILSQEGWPTHSLHAYRRFVGGGARALVERALPSDAGLEVDRILECFRAHYHAHLIVKSAPYPGIDALLHALCSQQLPLAILSNKPHTMVLEVAKHFFKTTPFVAVQGQVPEIPKKPNPTSVLSIADTMALPPAQIAYVGDSDVDIATGRAAGMCAIGVDWGFRGRSELEACGADHVLTCPADLLKLVG